MSDLGSLGEEQVIQRLASFAGAHGNLLTGIGDDCAVCRAAGSTTDQVFTSDATVEGIHFLEDTAPVRVGHKAVGRVLSDVASMGADPEWFLVNVVAPSTLDMQVLEGVYAGMRERLDLLGGVLIGGDLTEGERLSLHLFGTGRVPLDAALLRSGVQEGDLIWSTGALGGSGLGKHLDFMPRVREGKWLRETGWIHAMTDVSDGLFTDLSHLLGEQSLGACLSGEVLGKMSTVEAALFDGEDFELLFTTAEGVGDQLEALYNDVFEEPLWRLGTIRDGSGGIEVEYADETKRMVSRGVRHHF